MLNQLLSSLTRAKFIADPFPVAIVDDFLPAEIFNRLNASIPQDHSFFHAADLLKIQNRDWNSYVQAINQPYFYQQLLHLLGENLTLDPDMVGLRKRDFETRYVTESYIAIREPKPCGSWLLPPHIDSHHCILSGVHYFRDSADQDDGGALLLLQQKDQPLRSLEVNSIIDYVDPDAFEVAHKIEYKGNRLVFFMRSSKGWHAISPKRQHLRRSLNISLEFQNDGQRKKFNP